MRSVASDTLPVNGIRRYAPSLGIFPSLDPFEGIPGRPMSLNGYMYVEGDPVMDTDPSGQSPVAAAVSLCALNPIACALTVIAVGALALLWARVAREIAEELNNGSCSTKTDAFEDFINNLDFPEPHPIVSVTPGPERMPDPRRPTQAPTPTPTSTPEKYTYYLACGFDYMPDGRQATLDLFKDRLNAVIPPYFVEGKKYERVLIYLDWDDRNAFPPSEMPLTVRGNNGTRYSEKFDDALLNIYTGRVQRIYFNLEGILDVADSYINYADGPKGNNGLWGAKFFDTRSGVEVTAWELYHIRHNFDYCSKTFFFREGTRSYDTVPREQICA